MTPDVNVLIAAHREDHEHHRTALEWLERALDHAERGARLFLLPMVIAGFTRLVTHPKVFPEPTPVAFAVDFVEAVLTAPGVQIAALGPEWPGFARLCRDRGLAGNTIPDAWIAAATRAAGLHLVTFDRDFSRLLDSCEFTLLKV